MQGARRRIPGIEESLLVITGEKVVFSKGRLVVPDGSIIPFIEGDGTGLDIWRGAAKVLDRAVEFCCENMASP
jgi:isocitrate dehydrogenase